VGGPESLLWLADAGLLPPGPTLLAGDAQGGVLPTGPVLLTDGLRLRDVSFGSGRDVSSATLTPAEGADAHDYLPVWGKQWSTTAEYLGAAEIRASSTLAAKNPAGVSRPENLPFAAFDGDPSTSWRPDPGQPEVGQWIELTLPQARPVAAVTIHFDESTGGRPLQVTVDTGAEQATVGVIGSTVTVPLTGTNAVRTVRVTVDRFEETVERVDPPEWSGTFGISQIDIPGVSVERTLQLPTPPAGSTPATVLLTAGSSTPACFFGPSLASTVDGGARCAQTVARTSEDGTTIDRTFTLGTSATYQPTVWARPRPGAALDALLDRLGSGGVTVTASSSAFAEPATRPGVVVDGDPATTWFASRDDAAPELHFSWPTPRTISGLRLSLSGTAAGTPVAAVTVLAGGAQFTAPVTDGEVRFDAPVTTAELTLRLAPAGATRAYDPYQNKDGDRPLAVSEVTFLSSAATPTAGPLDQTAAVDLACGSGPTLAVGGRTVTTRLSATVGDLMQRRQVRAVPCDGDAATTLPAGPSHLIASASDLATAIRVALIPTAQAQPASGAVTVHIDQWASNRRLVTVPPHTTDLVLNVRENTNPGWVASIGGVTLTPIIVDGWQQGWVVPAGLSGQVELRYTPDASYRTGLIVGAVLLLLVVLLAVVRPRRRAAPQDALVAGPLGLTATLVAGAAALVVTGGALGGVIAAIGIAVVVMRAVNAVDSAPLTGRPASPGGLWSQLRRWIRLTQWLLPATLFVMASAGFAVIYAPHPDWRVQVVGVLAIGALWLSAVVFGSVTARSASALPGTDDGLRT
jgi:arabinofuranan 3-O-arabinosyltransferase